MYASEKLYDSLTKAFQSTLLMIRYAVYPATLVLLLVLGLSVWWGIDIRNSKSEISSTRNEIENIHQSLSLKSREIEISSKEIESAANKRFEELAGQFTKFESDFKQMHADFQNLRIRYEAALNQNEKLFKELKTDNTSLSDFSGTIKETITKYTDEIAYARKGIEQRKKDIESILKKRNEQLDAVGQTIVLLTEYLVLAQAGRNQFPDPNAKREISLINEMIYTLVPDANERNVIIKRINESMNQ
jgi:chromosome segregation ATPase